MKDTSQTRKDNTMAFNEIERVIREKTENDELFKKGCEEANITEEEVTSMAAEAIKELKGGI